MQKCTFPASIDARTGHEMATVSELVSFFADWTGTRPAEGRVRARHLREAGLLPSTGRGLGAADVGSIHCAFYLISFLAAEKAINGPEAVRFFSRMVPHRIRGDVDDLSDELRQLILTTKEAEKASVAASINKTLLLPHRTFGEVLALLIECGQTRSGREILDRNVATIKCGRHWPSASIEFQGLKNLIIQQDYRRRPIPGQSHRMEFPLWQVESLSHHAPIQVEATITGLILASLGDLCGEVEP